MPFGPCSLCAVSDNRSIASLLHVDRQLAGALRRVDVEQHAALAAERDRSRQCPDTPISLFTCISDTSSVSGRSAAATCSASTMPVGAGLQVGDRAAFALELAAGVEHGRMLGARRHEVAPRLRWNRAAPSNARLFASVAPEVQTICSGVGIRPALRLRRARVRRVALARAAVAVVDRRRIGEVPVGCRGIECISSITRGSTAVVAALSR